MTLQPTQISEQTIFLCDCCGSHIACCEDCEVLFGSSDTIYCCFAPSLVETEHFCKTCADQKTKPKTVQRARPKGGRSK